MRVRLTRQTDTRRRAAPGRRPHVVPHHADEAPVAPAPLAEADDETAAERRWRDAGGPQDEASYECSCGYVFEAAVSTSVTCPHCGAGQAW
jgi:hypothetical protein